jgi:hypothetical protein
MRSLIIPGRGSRYIRRGSLLAVVAVTSYIPAKRPVQNLAGPGLPLLFEHNLPSKLQLIDGDSVIVIAMLRNTTRSPLVLKFGSAALKIEAREVRRSTPGVVSREPRELGDRPQHWGVVQHLQSPSPSAIYTAGLIEHTLNGGDSLQFSWRADPLPVGFYSVRVCVDLVENPRKDEGGWQKIHWCAARGIDLTVAARRQ